METLKTKKYVVSKFLLVILVIMAVFAPFFAAQRVSADTAQPSSVSLSDMAVYNSLISANDTLFVIPYNIPYASTPSDTIDKTFIFKLMNGTDLLGSVTAYPYNNSGYGHGVVSFYFSANSSIAWGTSYSIVVSENPSTFLAPTSFSFTLPSSAYSSYASNQTANQALLYAKVVRLAQQLTIYWSMTSTPLTEQGGSGIILSSFGEAYFRNAIYGLQLMCPTLFLLQSENLDYSGRTWDYSFATLLQNTFSGTWVYDHMIAGFSGIWAVPTSTSLSFISLIIAIVVMCISIALHQGAPQSVQSGFLDAATVLIFASLSGFFSPLINVVFAFFFAFVGAWVLLFNKA